MTNLLKEQEGKGEREGKIERENAEIVSCQMMPVVFHLRIVHFIPLRKVGS